jgi:hypothetical protein
MPRRDDFDDDDRPRRRPRDDDDVYDRPARSRRRRDEDDEDDGLPVRPRKKGSSVGLILGAIGGVLLLCCGGTGVVAYLLSDRLGFESPDRKRSTNNLKQVGLGVHIYHDIHNTLPANSYAPDGRPLLSWRVHILPYIEQNALYGQFKLDEPWDSPNNLRLLNQMPHIYATAETQARAGPGKTFYRGFAHRGAVFERPVRPGNALGLANISDGLSNTIFVVEAGEAVEWTKPDDIDFGPGRPVPPLGAGRAGDDVLVLMGDGSTRKLKKTLPETTWRALVSYNGGEVIPPVK